MEASTLRPVSRQPIVNRARFSIVKATRGTRSVVGRPLLQRECPHSGVGTSRLPVIAMWVGVAIGLIATLPFLTGPYGRMRELPTRPE